MSAAARGQLGSALVAALFVLAILTGLGLSLLFLAQTDVRMNQAGLRAKRAFFHAEAGLEEARKAIYTANLASADPDSFDDELVAAGSGDGDIDLNLNQLAPVYASNGSVTGFAGVAGDVPVVPLTSFAGGTYAAFLSNDPVDGFGSLNDTNDRVMVTAIGTGPSRSGEIVQAVLERVSLPEFSAAITLLGDLPGFDGGTSAAKRYTGNDCQGVPGATGEPGYSVPTVGTTSPGARDEARTGVRKPGSYSSGSNSGTNTVQDVSATMNPLWNDCAFLAELASAVKDRADYICTAAAPCSHWAASSLSTITYADGDVTPGSGQGLLLVTGRLTILGNRSWSGVILVIGTGEIERSGAGNGSTSGATLVANIAGPDRILGTGDDCSTGTGGIDDSSYAVSGSGTHDLAFCSDVITQTNHGFPLRVVDFRQR